MRNHKRLCRRAGDLATSPIISPPLSRKRRRAVQSVSGKLRVTAPLAAHGTVTGGSADNPLCYAGWQAYALLLLQRRRTWPSSPVHSGRTQKKQPDLRPRRLRGGGGGGGESGMPAASAAYSPQGNAAMLHPGTGAQLGSNNQVFGYGSLTKKRRRTLIEHARGWTTTHELFDHRSAQPMRTTWLIAFVACKGLACEQNNYVTSARLNARKGVENGDAPGRDNEYYDTSCPCCLVFRGHRVSFQHHVGPTPRSNLRRCGSSWRVVQFVR